MKIKAKTQGLFVAVGVCVAGLAQADTTYTYTYDYNWTVNGCSGWNASCGLTGSQTGSAVTPTPAPPDPNAPPASIAGAATGWANTQGNSSTYSSQTLEQGYVQAWGGGMGVLNLDYSTSANGGESRTDTDEGVSPEHSTDNNGRTDSILYSFSQAVSLTQVSLSWFSNDSDITVLAFTGGAFDVNSDLAGLTYGQLVSNGWTLVGNYSNLSTSTPKAINAGGISSSYWLIGAANTMVTGGANDSNKDYVKIAALGGMITTQNTPHTPPPGGSVPEPGSLLLLGLGSLMLARVRAKAA